MPTVLKEVATGLMVIAGLGLGYALFHLLTGGTLRSLIYWTVQFNFINDYAQLASKPPSIAEIRALAPAYLLLIPFLLKLVWQWRQQDGWAHAHTFVLLLTSSLTIIPRFGSFHLQPSLPILAWVSGSIFADVARADRVEADPGMSQISKALMASIVGLWIVQCGFGYYSLQFTNEGPPKIWEYSPLLSLADDLSGYIRPGESILLLPDDEGVGNLYYLLDKQPPRSWVMTSYPWFGLETITEQTLAALRARPPDWVIYFPTRWGIESHNPTLVAYVREHYETQYRLEWEEGEVLIMGRRISADNNNESARKHSHCCMTKAELGGVTSLAPY